jgi:dipeptidyl aminopeptidase/acylaminoacyl peptidase
MDKATQAGIGEAYSGPMTQPTAANLVRAQTALESFSVAGSGAFVYALREVRRDRYRSHLWVGGAGGQPRAITSSDVRDTSPAISPDGRYVAFARTPVADDPPDPQLWVLPLEGGEPWQLTRLPHGAGSPSWSPDSKRLAFLAQAGAHRFAVGPEKKGVAFRARRITRLDFRDDEAGFLSRRTHVWVTGIRPGSRPRQLTSGDFDVAQQAWAPDGRWMAFAADMGPDATIAPRIRLYRVNAAGGPVEPLAELAGDAEWPAISPDGRQVAFIGTDVADPPDPVLPGLWVAPVDARKPPRCLTAALDRPAAPQAWADLVEAEDVPRPIWLDDSILLTIIGSRGRNLPYRVTLDGAAEPLVEPDARIVASSAAVAAGRVLLAAGLDGSAAEIHAVDHKTARPLTTNGSGWQRRFPAVTWEELTVDGPGGPIQTWLVSAPGARPGPRPTVIVVHGGPIGAHAPGGTLDSIMLAGHGYRVVLPNIRGSATFGSDWIAALGGRWGEPDAEDVLAVADALVKRKLADPHRLGIMGLSYGGYVTQWMIGVTDRFAAAVSENGVANQVSAWANSHFGVHYNRRAKLGDPLTEAGMQQLWATSPLRHAANVRTPLLMLQAEEDRICPAADNEQLFTALKVLGREVEYVLYPEEHHEMKNNGRPDRRIDRMERILAWFDRYLAASGG